MLTKNAEETRLLRTGSIAYLAVLGVALLAVGPARSARADEAGNRDEKLADFADLDGNYLALGPRGAALYSEETWDGAFGVEASLYRYRGDRRLSILGVSGGVLSLSELDGGQGYAELGAGGEIARGLRAGAALGVTTRMSPIRHMRWGAHATLWAYVGVLPYVRVGSLQDTGMFADFGVRLPLPALAW